MLLLLGDLQISKIVLNTVPGHCKRLAPTWKDLGDAYEENKDVVVAHVDCTADKSICKTADVSDIFDDFVLVPATQQGIVDHSHGAVVTSQLCDPSLPTSSTYSGGAHCSCVPRN